MSRIKGNPCAGGWRQSWTRANEGIDTQKLATIRRPPLTQSTQVTQCGPEQNREVCFRSRYSRVGLGWWRNRKQSILIDKQKVLTALQSVTGSRPGKISNCRVSDFNRVQRQWNIFERLFGTHSSLDSAETVIGNTLEHWSRDMAAAVGRRPTPARICDCPEVSRAVRSKIQ